MRSRAIEIPAGAVLTVIGKSNGLELESEACSHCGVKVFIRKVEPYMVGLLPLEAVERTSKEGQGI